MRRKTSRGESTEATEKHAAVRLCEDLRRLEQVEDIVAVESPVRIVVDGIHCVTIMCTPQRVEDLTAGHLLSEGIVDKVDQLADIRIAEGLKCEVTLRGRLDLQERLTLATPFLRIVTSGCGRGVASPFAKLADRLKPLNVSCETAFEASVVQKAMIELNRKTPVYRATRGVHGACICNSDGTLEDLAEDVGRHNAVDKVIGRCARERGSFEEKFLVSTGRLSGDIILKAARVKIPVVASLSAVLSSGIDLAEKTGVTAIGSTRGVGMKIYAHQERIRISW